ncbi:uncharacterized protein LOC106644828 [Copidosoma floridanum]|uniref:uncharacterized protein LOC106644828 n=1 Tax=Copidosoma floridanum TaxID=29053 RepID=UPI000C6F8779|nr:uncharacterized protein LOC106644828 [Copidosoma floridanum]
MDGMDEIQYFKEVILFFKEFQWLYNMPVTKILCRGSLDSLPADWLEALKDIDNKDLNDFVTEFKTQEKWPRSLLNFVESCRSFHKLPTSNISLSSISLPELFLKKLSLKKQHEIFYLARLVHEKCQQQEISFVVDLGCGLGYICQLLNHLYGYQVLGLESNVKNVEAAKVRQKNIFPDSLSAVKYVCCTISKDSSECIEFIVNREFGEIESMCLIGLHACSDLSVHMSNIYLEMEKAKLLVLISCCYHKLSLKQVDLECSDKEYFNYFPLSKTLENTVKILNVDVGEFLRRPFMRLACQETSDRWLGLSKKAHNEHSFHVLARAVLELYAVENDLQIKKLVRKATRKSQCIDFETYLKDCMQRYTFEKQKDCDVHMTHSVPWDDRTKNSLIILWKNNLEKQESIEVYTGLQLLLQHAAESLVLFDRLHYLREHNFEADIVPTMNGSLSPRCYAIISNKKRKL